MKRKEFESLNVGDKVLLKKTIREGSEVNGIKILNSMIKRDILTVESLYDLGVEISGFIYPYQALTLIK
jgi:hypothetical protein